MSVRKQDRNGVKVRVHAHQNGTWVEADCQCFGSPLRLHSNMDCPVRLAALRGESLMAELREGTA